MLCYNLERLAAEPSARAGRRLRTELQTARALGFARDRVAAL